MNIDRSSADRSVPFSSKVVRPNKHSHVFSTTCLSFLVDPTQEVMMDPEPVRGSLGVKWGYACDGKRTSYYSEQPGTFLSFHSSLLWMSEEPRRRLYNKIFGGSSPSCLEMVWSSQSSLFHFETRRWPLLSGKGLMIPLRWVKKHQSACPTLLQLADHFRIS